MPRRRSIYTPQTWFVFLVLSSSIYTPHYDPNLIMKIYTDKADYSWIGGLGKRGGWGRGAPLVSLWTPLDSLGLTWIHVNSLELTWSPLVSLGLTWSRWTQLDSFGITWPHLVSPVGLTWTRLDSLRLRTNSDSLSLNWPQLDSLGFTSIHLGSQGPTSTYLDSLGLNWIH